jgi:S1/P1 Nuclease
MLKRTLVTALAVLQSASAWGELGHRAVAYLAELQFTEATETMVKTIMRDEISHGRDISDAAVWADEVKIIPSYDWSKGLHFTGGGSAEVLACNVTVCAEKTCVIRAIANVSDILTKPNNPRELDVEALKFLIHFVGDIHQPLHANNYKRGANAIYVRFDNTTHYKNQPLRLHGVWDDYIPRKLNGLDFLQDNPPLEKTTAKRWATSLDRRNKQSHQFALHEECVDPSRGTTCPQAWAEESNRLVCPTVFRGNLSWVQTNDLFRSDY